MIQFSTMRSPDCVPPYSDGKVDWQWFQKAFVGTKIKPMDIDGVVERRGHFLMLESKGLGADIPKGQLLTLEAFHRLRVVTILFVWGKLGPTKYLLWREINSGGKRDSSPKDCNGEMLTGVVMKWRYWAEAHPIWFG